MRISYLDTQRRPQAAHSPNYSGLEEEEGEGLLGGEGEGLPCRPSLWEEGEEGERTSAVLVAATGGSVPVIAATGEPLA